MTDSKTSSSRSTTSSSGSTSSKASEKAAEKPLAGTQTEQEGNPGGTVEEHPTSSEGGAYPASAALVPRPTGPHGKEVDQFTRRTDQDALLGSWVDVVDGEHRGKFGHYRQTLEWNKDEFPKTALVQTRDANAELIEVPYESLRQSERHGGR